jgi:hypothetical protein
MKAIQAALALGVSLCAAPLIARAQAEDIAPTWACCKRRSVNCRD